jgi:hypothetical protein
MAAPRKLWWRVRLVVLTFALMGLALLAFGGYDLMGAEYFEGKVAGGAIAFIGAFQLTAAFGVVMRRTWGAPLALLAAVFTFLLGIALVPAQLERTGADPRLAAWAGLSVFAVMAFWVTWPGRGVFMRWMTGLGGLPAVALGVTIAVPLIAQIWVSAILVPGTRVPAISIDGSAVPGPVKDGIQSVTLKVKITNPGDVPLVLTGTMVKLKAYSVKLRKRPRTDALTRAWHDRNGAVAPEVEYGDEKFVFGAVPYTSGFEVQPHTTDTWTDTAYVKADRFDEVGLNVVTFFARGERLRGMDAVDDAPANAAQAGDDSKLHYAYDLAHESALHTLMSGGSRILVDLDFADEDPTLDVSYEPEPVWRRYGARWSEGTYFAALTTPE